MTAACATQRRRDIHFPLIPLPLAAPVSVMDINGSRLADVLCSAFLFLFALTDSPRRNRRCESAAVRPRSGLRHLLELYYQPGRQRRCAQHNNRQFTDCCSTFSQAPEALQGSREGWGGSEVEAESEAASVRRRSDGGNGPRPRLHHSSLLVRGRWTRFACQYPASLPP